MGKSTKKTPHENTAGKQTQEKMLSIMSHYRGANVDTQDNATTHRSSENCSHYCSLLVANTKLCEDPVIFYKAKRSGIMYL